jgi:hypothetical protein
MISIIHQIQNITPSESHQFFKRMSSRHIFTSNVTAKEKIFLLLLAEKISSGAIIVEVGTYLCGSSAIIAEANKNCKLFCFDTFDDLPAVSYHELLIKKSLGEGKSRSLENVKEFVKEYKNINLIKVNGRESVVSDWNTMIDVYFEDGNHWDPTLTQNIEYWSQWIKPNGYMILHDYRPQLKEGTWGRYPDVEKLVHKLQQDPTWKFLGFIDSMAIFQK